MTTSIAQSTQTEELPHYHDHDAHTPIKLSPNFINKYAQKESPLSPMGTFVFYRTYSRFSNKLGRRETWLEACQRAVEYNVGLAYNHTAK